MQYLWLILFGVLSFFVWAAVHELSHAVVARWKLGARDFQFKLYPHWTVEGRFVFASVHWIPERNGLEVGVLLAPRVPDLLAVALFPLTAPVDFLEWWQVALGCLAGGGLVDLFVGSLGISPLSDMRLAVREAKTNPNVLRVPGMVLVAVSAGWWLCLQFG